MMSAFLGTVIGIERAVASRQTYAFLAPFASGLGGVLLLAGYFALAAWMFVLAAVVFVVTSAALLRRQPALHMALLAAGAVAWLAGNAGFALGAEATTTFGWWFAFLVVTIAAERLEMTRLMPRRPGAQHVLVAIVSALALAAALTAALPRAGGVLYGAALAALALWLGAFDIARRTVRTGGLSRYMAVCLLAGYAWLAVAGVAWSATALGLPARDTALHALGLGFIVSMVMAHAPVILPAVTGVRLAFSNSFYLPLALLHGSLLLRVAGGETLRPIGATLNAAAIGLFAAVVIAAVLRWRARGGTHIHAQGS
jgi:hypothetical protein